ncbi:MAG: Ig-like domain-containing protein [Bacilli bacterium]|nr:Ig-like domain-containing protein [Bacilli bacterium]
MKFSRLILPCLLAIGLVSCEVTLKTITDVSVEIAEKDRFEGATFSTKDLRANLTYSNNSTETVSFNRFTYYQLNANYFSPSGRTYNLTNDFTLEEIGSYTIQVNYEPESKYHYPCSGEASFEVVKKLIPATSLTLGSDSLSLSKGGTGEITYSILPENSTTEAPTFTSSDTSVATVDEDGVVTAIEEGQCIVTAKADDIVKEVLITVTPDQTLDYVFTSVAFATSIGDWDCSIEGSSMDSRQNRGVGISEETTIISPLDFNGISNISFDCSTGSSSNIFSLAGVKNFGSIETYVGEDKIGEATFTSYGTQYKANYPIEESVSGKIKLVIEPNVSSNVKIYLRSVSITTLMDEIYPTSISLFGEDTVGIGDHSKIGISYSPVNANMRVIEWTSSDEEVLTVARDGTIYGHKNGTATVTAKANTSSGFTSASKTINVVKIPVQSVELNADSIEVYEGKSKTIDVTILPSNATVKTVTYTSSNPNIATVDASGNITGVAIGECTITAKSVDDPTLISTCKVTVLEQPALQANYMSYNYKNYTTNNYYEIDSAPSTGELKLLVIPVWFTDSSTFITNKENVRDDIRKVYFGTESETGWNSVKSYYETESDGKLSILGSVSEWYECGKSYSAFNYDSGGSNTTTTQLVKTATDWYFSNHTSDSRRNYDSDHDGYLDGVILIYGCPDHSSFESKTSIYSKVTYGDNLWAYTFWLQNRNYRNLTTPGPNSFFWASYDFMYNETTSLTRTGKSSYGAGNTSHCSVDGHTFIHEMGHIFGLDDYYDYSNYYRPAGGFSMQDFNVGGHDPFSCLALGWAKAYVPIESCSVTLNPFQTSHEVILLSPSWNAYNSPFDEYLLLELYTPTGLNAFDTDYSYSSRSPRGVNATGIRLWHIDARIIKYVAGVAQATPTYTYPVTNGKTMMSNTYYSSSTSSYISPLGRSYADYNILQLIRNSTSATYKPNDNLRETYLFKNGSSFDMNTYRRQFVQSGKLNSGSTLGWKFSVSIEGSGNNSVATVTINKD